LRRKINPSYEDFVGWVSPKGEKVLLWKDTHETLADKLLTRNYDDWPSKAPIKGRRWTNSDALKMAGWIRVSGTNYSVHRFLDSVGRVQSNLVDLIAELPDDEKIFVDDWIDGDLIYNKTAGWFVDKYQ
jgi:hypothetical protein